MRAATSTRILFGFVGPLLTLLLIRPAATSALGGLPIGEYHPKRPQVFGKRHHVTICPDPSAIRRVIRKHLVPIRKCYQDHALSHGSQTAGSVVVGFTITTTGRVRAVRIQRSGLAHKPTERCLVRVLGRMRFPKLYGIIHVKYPFLFKPR